MREGGREEVGEVEGGREGICIQIYMLMYANVICIHIYLLHRGPLPRHRDCCLLNLWGDRMPSD